MNSAEVWKHGRGLVGGKDECDAWERDENGVDECGVGDREQWESNIDFNVQRYDKVKPGELRVDADQLQVCSGVILTNIAGREVDGGVGEDSESKVSRGTVL